MAASTRRTIVATGASSGLGFEAIKQLLTGSSASSTAYHIFIGARNVRATRRAFDALQLDSRHSITTLPLELGNLGSIRYFAECVLKDGKDDELDILLLSAAISKAATSEKDKGGKWSEAYRTNCLGHQYLLFLLKDKIEASRTRIAVVSSLLYRRIENQDNIANILSAESQVKALDIYKTTKFVQLLQTMRWKQILRDKAEIVAVSPGFVPATGLSRETSSTGKMVMQYLMPWAPFATSLRDGGRAILRAMVDDLDVSNEHVLLEKTGEWSDLDRRVLDPALQDEWWIVPEDMDELEQSRFRTAALTY